MPEPKQTGPLYPKDKATVPPGPEPSLRTHLEYQLSTCGSARRVTAGLTRAAPGVHEQQRCSPGTWELHLCRLQRAHRTPHQVPCHRTHHHPLTNRADPGRKQRGFGFQDWFAVSCSFLTGFARFRRLEKTDGKAARQPRGTGRGPNAPPRLLTLPLLDSQRWRELLRFEEDLSKPTLLSKPSGDRLNLKSQALIKHHQISNEKSCCSVIPGYVKQPETIPDWKPQ